MKKSKSAVLFFFLGAAVFGLYAQEIRVDSVRRQGESFLLDCRILLDDAGQLITALDAGDTVMIGIRLRQSSSDYFFFHSQAGYYEYQRRIRWDPVESLYVIEEPEGIRRYFLHKEAFLEAVLDYRELPVPLPRKEHSFRLRGEIQWKVLMPPLNILRPFLPNIYSVTPWNEINPFQPYIRTGVSGE